MFTRDEEILFEEKCDKKHEASRKYRLSKVNKKIFKSFWRKFYGLKEVKEKYFIVGPNNQKVSSFFSEYEADRALKKLNNKNLEVKLLPCEKDYELEYFSPFDTLRYKAFLRYVKKIEKNGLELKRDWLESYSSKICYSSNSDYGTKWEKFKNIFRHKYHHLIWDGVDESDEILKVTIAGLYHAYFGHIVCHRESAHRMWAYRKMILKAYNYDDWWEYHNIKKELKEKYNINYDIEIYETEDYIENGDSALGTNKTYFNATVSPKEVEKIVERKAYYTDKEYRQKVIEKIGEIENFVYEKRADFNNINEEWLELKKEAYLYKAENEQDWID